MKILLAPLGTRGDVQPTVALARALRARGHAVSFCCNSNFQGWIEGEGFSFLPVRIDAEKLIRGMGNDHQNPLVLLKVMKDVAKVAMADLDRACRDVDVVVGAGVQAAAYLYCEARRIPYLYAAYCPVAVRTSELPPYPVSTQTLPRWMNRLWWSAQGAFFNWAVRRITNETRASLGLGAISDAYDAFTQPGRTLGAFDPRFAPHPASWGERVASCGFWLLDDMTPLEPELEAFLGRGPAPVYIGFGSMGSSSPAALTQTILSAVKEAGVRAVVSAGWADLGRGGELPENCLVIGAASHSMLFPRVAAAVHHGGAGTTATAARAGIPQLAVPHTMDQYYWGHRIEKLQLGPRAILVGRLTVARLASALRALSTSEVFREAASAMGAHLRAADGLARAVEQIEQHASRSSRA